MSTRFSRRDKRTHILSIFSREQDSLQAQVEAAATIVATRAAGTSQRHGPRKWILEPPSLDEVLAGSAFQTLWLPRDTKSLVFASFQELVLMCPASWTPQQLCDSWLGQGLKYVGYGTLTTYSQYILSHGDLPRPFKRPMARINKACALAYADSDTKTTKKINRAEILTVLKKGLETGGGAVWTVIFLMAVTGLRCADVARLRTKQIRIDGHLIRVEVRVSKNRRRRSKRTFLVLALSWFGLSRESLVSTLVSSEPDGRPFAEVDTNAVNRVLPEGYTSKSLRHYFLGIIFTRMKGNLDRVSEYSLHLEKSTIKAFYVNFIDAKTN